MFSLLKMKNKYKSLFIPDPLAATPPIQHKGLPEIKITPCQPNCHDCLDVCPTGALSLSPLNLDMGKCIFCGDCMHHCPLQKISFTHYHHLASSRRDALIVNEGVDHTEILKHAIAIRKEITSVFSRSLKLRQVSAGGCNGCEMELNACGNINFDMARYGIEFVASPKHADGIVITGPISNNMAEALNDAYQCTPNPKIIVLTGACAISGGIFKESPALKRDFLNNYPIDLYIPGCPIHPLTFIHGIVTFIGQNR